MSIAIAIKFDSKEKEKMRDTAIQIADILEKQYPKDAFSQSVTLEFMYRGLQSRLAMENIIIADKTGKDNFNKLNHARKIVEGMQDSEFGICWHDNNLVLFRNCDDVWMQYYLGKFLQKPTFIIAEEKERPVLEERKVNLNARIYFVPIFSSEQLEIAMQNIKGDMGELHYD